MKNLQLTDLQKDTLLFHLRRIEIKPYALCNCHTGHTVQASREFIANQDAFTLEQIIDRLIESSDDQ